MSESRFFSRFFSIRGDWMSDRLTIAEKLAYDRAMGYVTINTNSSSRRNGSMNRRSSSRKASGSICSPPLIE